MDVGDPVQVKKKKTKIQLLREREVEDLKVILNSAGGRDFVWRLLSQCGNYKISFTGDNNLTNFNEGKRQIGLWLLAEIGEANPHVYIQMQSERVEDE
ncbi:hypothetical protein LCGC14_1674210 [marine sediment metagenome]|uniref:Bbp19-like phage domain-containing protein n=1 Tax=marine sediment metagenome TaxID=412755 RepID=A0A0F9HQJ3_9ZZZZ